MRLRPSRRLRVLAAVAAVLVATAGALLLALPILVDVPAVQALLRTELSRLLDRPVRFDRVTLSLTPRPAVRVLRLVIANPPGFGPEPLLAVEEARIRVRLLPLLRGRLQFGEVTLTAPRVVVEQRRDGAWNLAPAAARPAPAAPFVLVSRVSLHDGRLEIRIPGDAGQPLAAHLVDRIDLALEDLGWATPVGVRVHARVLGGVALEVEGQIGPLAHAAGDLGALPARLAVRFRAEEIRAPATSPLALSGAGEGVLRLEGRLGHLAGDGRLALSRATIVHRPAACTPPGPRALTVEAVELPVRVAGPVLTVEPFAFRLGGGTVRGAATLTYRAGTPGVRLTGIELRGLAAEALLVDFLCQPYAVTGRLDATGEVAFEGTGPELRRSARGQWEARVGPGRLVGPAALTLVAGAVRLGTALYSVLNVDLPTSLFASPLEFDALRAAGRLADAELRVRDVVMTSRRFRVAGHGTYGFEDERLDFTLDVEAGRTAYGIRVGGTAGAPTYVPVPRTVLRGITDALSPLFDAARGRSGETGRREPATSRPH